MPQRPPVAGWSRLVRVAFRFWFLYWVIYMLPAPGAVSILDLLPWLGDKVGTVLGWPMHTLAPWVGSHVFHLTGEGANWHPTGSGDTAMNYMQFAIGLVAAIVGAVIWSIVSEVRGKRKQYSVAYAWLRLFLRFTLAVTLLEYGFIKVFPLQFGPLNNYGLTETYGDSTPMHLLWTFIGQSRPYMLFGGLMEALPGALLLFRRTSTVGLLVAIAVLANVVMLNFAYDVPVKLYSTHLLLMALFLLLPDARPVWRFLVERREATLTGVWIPRWERRPLRIGGYVLQGLVVVSVLYSIVWGVYQMTRPAPLEGTYAVDRTKGFDGDTAWVQANFESGGGQHYIGLVGPDKKVTASPVTYDLKTQTMGVTNKDLPASLHWSKGGAGELTLTGTYRGASVSMNLHRTSPKAFALNQSGFHWVAERANNY